MLFTTTLSTPLILGLGLAFVASSLSRDTPAAQGLTGVVTTSSITATQWSELNSTLGGKLSTATPFAASCFDVVNGASNEDKSGCAAIQSGYRDPFYRASRFNAFLWPAWEGCTALEETCQLDPSSTNNSIAWEGKNCAQGSLSEYFVEASSPQDVQNVLRFVRDTGVLVSIKNSGHDFGGRGAQIGSLSIWTHNLNTISHDPSFVPEGALEYTGGTSVLTLGAGVSFYSAYEFADAHNLTVVGGYHPTVGASGGWLMGGGHSILSPVFGLGVDRVLQFKIVTPDGNYLTVNEFLHPDLFWALRGGGGGTFGVVIESTIKVEPKMKLQVASLSFTQNSDNARGFLKLVINNSVKWGKAGWGGHISPRNLVSVTPLLSLQEAQESMKDAVDYTLSQNGTAVIEELPSWLAFFNKYVKSSAIGGYNAIGGAWLMPNSLFDSEQTKEQLLDALMRMLTAGNPHITTATPYLYDYAEGTTSAAPAWRNSLWHAVFQYEFPWNATIDGVREHFQTITDNIQNLRDLSPESGAYGTEGDIYELDHERAFWGDNYPKLLELKQKYDPNGILDCWKCVGWRGPSDPRYKCYVDAQKSATDLF